MSKYEQGNDLEQIAKKVIKQFGDLKHLDDEECRIGFQWADTTKKSKGKLVMADTTLVQEKLKAFLKLDFIITFYSSSCTGLDEERMCRLMYHELKHVGFGGKDDLYIVPHDLEDFRDVVDKWGTDWLRKDDIKSFSTSESEIQLN